VCSCRPLGDLAANQGPKRDIAETAGPPGAAGAQGNPSATLDNRSGSANYTFGLLFLRAELSECIAEALVRRADSG